MKDDFLDIVAVIVRQMAEDEDIGPRDRSIIEGLMDEGYDLMDIDDALSWFESLASGKDELLGAEFWPGFKGVRVMARWEREAMSPAAYAYLMKLNRSGLVEDSFREAIMDKVIDLSISDFGIEQMKALLGLVLYSQGRLIPESSLIRKDSGRSTNLN
ncbi:MAG: DUF494 family protein [Nitrospirota bacterium]